MMNAPTLMLLLSDLPTVAQQAFLSDGSPRARAQLSSNPFLDVGVANEMCRRFPPRNVGAALRTVDDPKVIAKALAGSHLARTEVLWNPNVAPNHLVDVLTGTDARLALIAAANPTTPLDVRQRVLSPAYVSALVGSYRGSTSDAFVRAWALVDNNRWMLDTPQRWDGVTRRAIASHPGLTVAQANRLRASGYSRWEDFKLHPSNTAGVTFLLCGGTVVEGAVQAGDLSQFDSSADLLMLSAIGGPALDMYVLGHPNCSVDIAAAMLSAAADITRPAPTPMVVAAMVSRFGAHVLICQVRHFARTRINAAAWLCPGAAVPELNRDLLVAREDCDQAVGVLGDDGQAWKVFTMMLPRSSVGVVDTARAAAAVCG